MNCNLPLRWQVFGGAIFIIIFMHLTQLATQALLGERVPQDVERIPAASQTVNGGIVYNDDELPSMHLLMEPVFDNATPRPEPIAININMTLNAASGRFAPGRPLLTLPLMISTVPSARYDRESNPISAYGGRGQPIQLSYQDEDPVAGPRVWSIGEDDEFDPDSTHVTVSFTAPYRKTNKSTGSGARVDLRRDVSGGGLMGQGISFLPMPPPLSSQDNNGNATAQREGDESWRERWNVTLEWDLAGSPTGTRGAWSFGDLDKTIAIGPLDKLVSHSVFAVGYLQRFPDWDADQACSYPASSSSNIQAPTYWFEPSPYNVTALAIQSLESYTRIANFFNTKEPLRVFIRHIEAHWGGTGASKSFLLEYSDETPQYADAFNLAQLLAHETVHAFALLDRDAHEGHPRESPWQEEEGTWYVEGVASYVGDLVGLNNGKSSQREEEEDEKEGQRQNTLLRVLNNQMQAYYTAPRWVLEMDYGDVLANYWRSTVDVTRVSYSRGFVLLTQLDGMICKATGGEKSMDDVILALYKMRLGGEPCTIHDFSSIVSNIIGREAYDEVYAAFFRGDLIVPAEDSLERHGLKLLKRDWNRFELGFETDSLRAFKVKGLVKGSNAEKAGVREGDEIVQSFMLWTVEDNLDGNMKITVLRDGREVGLEWRPRSDEVVEAYGWVEIDGGDPDEL